MPSHRITLAVSGPGLHEITGRVAELVREGGVDGGPVHPLPAPHLRQPAHPGERRPVGAARPRGVARPPGAGGRRPLHPSQRGARRHAGAHQGGADRGVVVDPDRGRRAGARHLAGDLPLGAPAPARQARAWSCISRPVDIRPRRWHDLNDGSNRRVAAHRRPQARDPARRLGRVPPPRPARHRHARHRRRAGHGGGQPLLLLREQGGAARLLPGGRAARPPGPGGRACGRCRRPPTRSCAACSRATSCCSTRRPRARSPTSRSRRSAAGCAGR